MDYEKFKIDKKTVDAVIKNFIVIGEASKNIPKFIKDKYSEIDWQGMAGLRDRIVHAYFEISIEILWEIIKNELPSVKNQLNQILQLGKEEDIE